MKNLVDKTKQYLTII